MFTNCLLQMAFSLICPFMQRGQSPFPDMRTSSVVRKDRLPHYSVKRSGSVAHYRRAEE
jgi:hypothetical protein